MKRNLACLVHFIILILLFSCKEETNTPNPSSTQFTADTTSSLPVNMKLWAEQVESSINLSVPDDWSPEDWNNIFRNIDHNAIYTDVVDAVLNGKQTAHNFFTDEPFSLEQIKTILENKVTVLNKDSTLVNSETKIALEKIGPNTISLMRVREKIYFDRANFKLERKPTSLILYVNHYSEDGSFIGYKPLFYVKLNS